MTSFKERQKVDTRDMREREREREKGRLAGDYEDEMMMMMRGL